MTRFTLAALSVLGFVVATLVLPAGPARADDVSLAPDKAAKALDRLGYFCWTQKLCPLSAYSYDLLKRAVAGQRDAQYFFGFNLINGTGVPADREAGILWIVLAAEAGEPLAAGYVEKHLQSGDNIEVDETKMANTLKTQADAGDVASMRILGPMMIRGRGTAQDPSGGMAILIKAAERSPGGEVENQIADLFLVGTNGLLMDREKAMEWYARGASRGNLSAMSTLGGLWENEPLVDMIGRMRQLGLTGHAPEQKFKRNIVNSLCWRLRAALLGSSFSQYELALQLSREDTDSYGNKIQPDLLEADYWFRLGAQHPENDNPQVRGRLEPSMTTVQLDSVKKRVAAFHQMSFEEMKAATIPFPGKPAQNCPAMPTF